VYPLCKALEISGLVQPGILLGACAVKLPFYIRGVDFKKDSEGFHVVFQVPWWGVPFLLAHSLWRKVRGQP
jgi:hypothetical protein